MKKILLIISILTLSLIALSGCLKKNNEFVEHPPTTVLKDIPNDNNQESIETNQQNKPISITPELTKEEAEKYNKKDLTVAEKITLSEELSIKMPKNGMEQIKKMFPDITTSKSISSDDPRNMMMMGTESWEYSVEGDITIVVCDKINTPIYVFKGQNISEDDIQNAIEVIHDILIRAEEEHTAMTEQGPGRYIKYTENAISNTPGKKIFFFYASWDPDCETTDKNLIASVLPNGVTVFKTNYDTENILKKKYSITNQNTFVQIDDNGDMIKKWIGGTSTGIVENLK